MRISTIAAGLLLLMLSVFPAAAETFKTPKALLTALYAYDTDNSDADSPSLYSPFFSDHLNQRFKDDQAGADGEVGAIDFDPVISGQDGKATNVKVGVPIILDNTAEVEVTFRNFDQVTLFYSLVKEHGGWKVDDIANQEGEYPWSLSALFDEAK